jgi:hypothetical protein
MPLILLLIGNLAPRGKREGAARTYFELWMRDFGEGIVELTDPETHAFAAGYTSSARGARSWRECVDALEKLGFIRVAPRGQRRYGYVLLIHPDKAVTNLSVMGLVDDAWYSEYQQRRVEIGALSDGDDLAEGGG